MSAQANTNTTQLKEAAHDSTLVLVARRKECPRSCPKALTEDRSLKVPQWPRCPGFI